MQKGKIRIAVLFGGRSGEHEVSFRSAQSVVQYLDPKRYDVFLVGIDRQGQWHRGERDGNGELKLDVKSPMLFLPPVADLQLSESRVLQETESGNTEKIDVVFPAMHGTYCEDGTLQGFLETADVPYVGCGVLSSAVGMDKDVAKRLVREAGLKTGPYFVVRDPKEDAVRRVEKEFGFPVFVKPANSGSSVGIQKVQQGKDLKNALEAAFQFDRKVLIEKAINCREIEVSVLENPIVGERPLVSLPGEVQATHEFYSYEAKYLDENGAKLMIPAPLEKQQLEEARLFASRIFEVLECEGMARVDLFLEKKSGEFLFNEINTLPGFTSISMYPKMWEASGVSYQELLTRLVELAILRHQRKSRLQRDFRLRV